MSRHPKNRFGRPLIWIPVGAVPGLIMAVVAVGPDAASVIFFGIGLTLGLMGTIFHGLYQFFQSKKISALLWPCLSVGFLVFLYFTSQVCNYSEKEARQKILAHLTQSAKYDPRFLGEVLKTNESCIYRYMYEGGGQKIEFVLNRGEIHLWNITERGPIGAHD